MAGGDWWCLFWVALHILFIFNNHVAANFVCFHSGRPKSRSRSGLPILACYLQASAWPSTPLPNKCHFVSECCTICVLKCDCSCCRSVWLYWVVTSSSLLMPLHCILVALQHCAQHSSNWIVIILVSHCLTGCIQHGTIHTRRYSSG